MFTCSVSVDTSLEDYVNVHLKPQKFESYGNGKAYTDTVLEWYTISTEKGWTWNFLYTMVAPVHISCFSQRVPFKYSNF